MVILEITCRQASLQDIPQLVNLMNSQYQRPYNEGYFIWQYFKNVYPTILMCAFSRHELIGMFGLQKKALNNGAIAGQAIDLLVAKEHRGKGIFKLMGEKAIKYFNDLDILCVLPNYSGKIAVEKSFKWKTITKIDTLVCESNNSKDKSPLNLSKFNKNHSFHFKYDESIFKWRFKEHPIYNFNFFKDGNNKIITKIFIDPLNNKKYGDIVYYNFTKINKQIFPLIELSINKLKSEGAERVTTWALSNTVYYHIFREYGFIEEQEERYFCIHVNNSQYGFLTNVKNWHLVQSDAEFF